MLRNGFAMPRHGGEAIPIDVPAANVPHETAMALFGEAATTISKEFHARNKARAECPEWLQRVCYQLIGMMVSHGFNDLFGERVKNYGRKWGAKSANSNPFHQGLFAIFAHDKGALGAEKRWLFGLRLWYAYRHYVPHEFLMGFLHQVWTNSPEQRVLAGHIEHEFELWVAFSRARDPAADRRGTYPAAIEDRADQIREVSPLFMEAPINGCPS